jgi:hypothetical protein
MPASKKMFSGKSSRHHFNHYADPWRPTAERALISGAIAAPGPLLLLRLVPDGRHTNELLGRWVKGNRFYWLTKPSDDPKKAWGLEPMTQTVPALLCNLGNMGDFRNSLDEDVPSILRVDGGQFKLFASGLRYLLHLYPQIGVPPS